MLAYETECQLMETNGSQQKEGGKKKQTWFFFLFPRKAKKKKFCYFFLFFQRCVLKAKQGLHRIWNWRKPVLLHSDCITSSLNTTSGISWHTLISSGHSGWVCTFIIQPWSFTVESIATHYYFKTVTLPKKKLLSRPLPSLDFLFFVCLMYYFHASVVVTDTQYHMLQSSIESNT